MSKEKIAKALCDAKVVKFGTFKLVSGKITPVYFDLRVLPSNPKSMQAITEELVKKVKELKVDVVAGAETAGIPLAAAIGLKAKMPMIYVRKRPKQYGTMSMIEGLLEKNQKVALIDDMTTDGYSKIGFIDGIRQAGGIVTDVVIVLDREQGGEETLKKEGAKLYSLITLREVLDYMKQNDLVEAEKYNEVVDYINQDV